jgi:hypothetical protein
MVPVEVVTKVDDLAVQRAQFLQGQHQVHLQDHVPGNPGDFECRQGLA